MSEQTTDSEGGVTYCVVAIFTGEIAYHGQSLSAAAAEFEPGHVAGKARTAEMAERVAGLVAEEIRRVLKR